MSLCTNIYISGSFNQAIFIDSDGLKILNGCEEPRQPNKNEVKLFFDCASTMKKLDPTSDFSLERIQQELKQERDLFTTLNGLLVGMDTNHPEDLRIRWMKRSEEFLQKLPKAKLNICKSFLIPVNRQDWNYDEGLNMAQSNMLSEVSWMYEQLAKDYVDACLNCIETTIFSNDTGSSLANRKLANSFIEQGLIGEILYALSQEQPKKVLNNLVFQKIYQHESDPNRQTLSNIIKKVSNNDKLNITPPTDNDVSNQIGKKAKKTKQKSNRIKQIKTIEHALLWVQDQQTNQHQRTMHIDISTINNEIDFLIGLLGKKSEPVIFDKIIDLIEKQASKSKFSDIIKTLTSLATKAKQRNYLNFSEQIYHNILKFSIDSPAHCGYAELLRAMGQNDDALAAYSKTIQLFPENAVAHCGYAELLRAMGQNDDALAAYSKTIQLFPQNAVARNGYAELLRAMGQNDDALAAYSKTIQLFPQDAVARNGYAELLRAMGQNDDALAAYSKTIQLFPQDAVARNGYAELLRAMGQNDDALAAYSKTIQLFPENAVAHCGYAELLRAMGQNDDALAAYSKTIQLFPENAVAHCGYAELLRAMGQNDDALAAYSKTIQLFPQNAVARNGYAELLRAMGQNDDALAAYSKTIQLFPQDAVAHCGYAELLRAMGQNDDALAAYSKTIQLFPQDAFAHCGYAELLRAMGQNDDALAAYSKTIQLFPENAVAHCGYAELLRAMGQNDDALAAYSKTIQLFPQNAVARNGYAELLRAMGQNDDALAAYSKTIQLFPQDAVARNGYAELLRAMGQNDDALAAYSKTIQLFPQDAVAHCGYAELLRAMGQNDDALAAYSKTIQLFPQNAVARNGLASLNSYLGNFDQVITSLDAIIHTPQLQSDWISLHIVAMAYYKKNVHNKAQELLQKGADSCPFLESRRIFSASLSFIRMTLGEYTKAEEALKELSQQQYLPQETKICLGVLYAHTLGHLEKTDEAGIVLDNLITVDFMALSQQKATKLIKERFGIDVPQPEHPQELDAPIHNEIYQLLDFASRKPMNKSHKDFTLAA